MSVWASLKRSSPSIIRNVGIQRLNLRPFSNIAAFGESNYEDKTKGSAFGAFLTSVSGIIVGSSLGFFFWSSSFPESSFCYADWETKTITKDDLQNHSAIHEAKQERKPKYIFGEAYRRRVFFNYEKRIRLRSPPEKVFEYFASFRTPEGELFMTPADLMRAIVPVFPPSESNIVREGYLRGERRPGELHCANSTFFMLFDTDNDGLISFPEYIFFVTLLSIPETSFSVAFKMFDLDNNGAIEKEEFKKVMALMRSYNRQGASHKDGLRFGLKVGGSVENGGLVEYFFGKDGNECLQHEKFVEFFKDLHDEILRLEFAHYDYKLQGTISAKDFALSMVASADLNHINKFLDRVDEMNNDPHLRDLRVTFEEFKAFAELRKRLQPLALAIFSYGKVNGFLTKQDFQRAASHVCGISVTDNVVDIIFHIFDTNHDGSLSSVEFLGVLQRRERDITQPVENGVAGLLSCWWNCSEAYPFAQLVQ
ncbi:calcium uptake protein, mitochondrial-like [Tasmannia lanceolata]|uniref:calcium uptake protein, mitochondrial-like n=1 Tax=Tasmannia lanceolata TaxID=3420 RepID=UPI004063E1B0